jgi:hypothetical protein
LIYVSSRRRNYYWRRGGGGAYWRVEWVGEFGWLGFGEKLLLLLASSRGGQGEDGEFGGVYS